MEEHNPEAIANSILEHLPTTTKVGAYVENIGRSSLLLQRDGEGQVPLMSISDNDTVLLYNNSPQELRCSIKEGLEALGYHIPYEPAKIGGGLLYYFRNNQQSD